MIAVESKSDKLTASFHAEVVELVDAPDSKSGGAQTP